MYKDKSSQSEKPKTDTSELYSRLSMYRLGGSLHYLLEKRRERARVGRSVTKIVLRTLSQSEKGNV